MPARPTARQGSPSAPPTRRGPMPASPPFPARSPVNRARRRVVAASASHAPPSGCGAPAHQVKPAPATRPPRHNAGSPAHFSGPGRARIFEVASAPLHRFKRLVPDMPAWVAFGWSLWTLLGAHLFFLRPPALLHFYDEGYINAFAWRMIDGHMLPYVDAVSHRGPLLYWIAALAAKLGSPTSWVPIRICSLVVTIAPVIFIFAAAYRAKKPLAGGIAAIATVVALLLALGPGDGIAFNGEHVLNVFATAAFFSLVVALDRRRPTPSVALVGLAGALAAMSALSKQVGAAMIPALALWVIAAAVSRRSLERSQRWKLVLAFAAGLAVPVATVLLRYAVVHELNTFIYWAIRYNSEIYMAPYAHAIWRT